MSREQICEGSTLWFWAAFSWAQLTVSLSTMSIPPKLHYLPHYQKHWLAECLTFPEITQNDISDVKAFPMEPKTSTQVAGYIVHKERGSVFSHLCKKSFSLMHIFTLIAGIHFILPENNLLPLFLLCFCPPFIFPWRCC